MIPLEDTQPIFYTPAEGARWQRWTPEITQYNALLWADGTRWDSFNKTKQSSAYSLEQVDWLGEFIDRENEEWHCEAHNCRAPHLDFKTRLFVCDPASDAPFRHGGTPCHSIQLQTA